MSDLPPEINSWASKLIDEYRVTVTEVIWDGKMLKIWGDYSDEFPCYIEAWIKKDGSKCESFNLTGSGGE
jgi:hypothetical protein